MYGTDQKFIHPNVIRWIKSKVDKKIAIQYEDELNLFLQDLWGPMVNYNFDELGAGYPYRRKKFFDSFYVYHEPLRLAFEFVGDTIVEGRCTQDEFSDYLFRKNVLTLSGWRVLPFCIENLRETDFCRDVLERVVRLAEKQPSLLR